MLTISSRKQIHALLDSTWYAISVVYFLTYDKLVVKPSNALFYFSSYSQYSNGHFIKLKAECMLEIWKYINTMCQVSYML